MQLAMTQEKARVSLAGLGGQEQKGCVADV